MNNESESTKACRSETRKQLLINLYPFSHGAWAHTNISRIALFGRNLAEAASPKQHERFRAALTEYIERVRPALEGIIRESQVIQSDSTLVGPLQSHADKLGRIAHTLSVDARLPAEELQRLEEEIPKHAERLLSVLHATRELLFRDFRCRPDGILRSIVKGRQAGYSTAGTTYIMEMADPEQLVVADEEDFRRVVDTLIKGIQGKAGGRTSLIARTAGDRWLLEIHNDKLFVPLPLWREVFMEKGLSGHEELLVVPEIVGKYDGEVCVKESNEGAGTTILLRLRIQRQ